MNERSEHRAGTVKPFKWVLRCREQVSHKSNTSKDLERAVRKGIQMMNLKGGSRVLKIKQLGGGGARL